MQEKIAVLYREKLNWSVFPVSRKKPLVKWKPYQSELPTTDEIKSWWRQWPDANIGLITGKSSGIVVLDCDSTDGIDWVKKHKIPDTVSAQSSGPHKRHYYFKYPDKMNHIPSFVGKNSRWNVEVDVRADGGYIVLPPSKHKSGVKYQWLRSPMSNEMAEVQPWMFRFIFNRQKDVRIQPKRYPDKGFPEKAIIPKPANKGGRDDYGFRLACRYIHTGLTEYQILAKMRNWNSTCSPPMPDNQVTKLVKSALKYRRKK